MKSFIRKLFDGMLETPEYEANFGIEMNSMKLHDKLDNLLSGEANKLFNDFADACYWEQAQAEEQVFRYGFKTAVLLMLEVLG